MGTACALLAGLLLWPLPASGGYGWDIGIAAGYVGLVFTAGKPRILLIESDPKSAKDLAWAMDEQEMQVDVRPSTGMPESLA